MPCYTCTIVECTYVHTMTAGSSFSLLGLLDDAVQSRRRACLLNLPPNHVYLCSNLVFLSSKSPSRPNWLPVIFEFAAASAHPSRRALQLLPEAGAPLRGPTTRQQPTRGRRQRHREGHRTREDREEHRNETDTVVKHTVPRGHRVCSLVTISLGGVPSNRHSPAPPIIPPPP